MNPRNIVLYESEYARVKRVLSRTQQDLGADLVLLIDRSGQQMATEGPASHLDLMALSSLAAANLAATDSLARLVGEPEFSILYHQGEHRCIHISGVSKRFSLVLLFDKTVPVGKVRWKVKRATGALDEIFSDFQQRLHAESSLPAVDSDPGPLFTDEEIERLFVELKIGK